MSDKHTVPRVAYRWLSGRHLSGNGRGGYLAAGPGHGWGALPGWKRQAARVGVPAAAYLLAQAPPIALAVALVVIVRGVRWCRRQWRTRRFRGMYIRPTVGALAPALGDAPVRLHVDPSLGELVHRLTRPMSPAETAARTWYGQRIEPVLRWAPDRVQRATWAGRRAAAPAARKLDLFRRPVAEDKGPRIELFTGVPYLTTEQRLFVSSVVNSKIPAGELVESWDQVGTAVTATWTVRRRPPTHVGYADLEARFATLPEWEFFLGLGVGGKPVVISLKDDSPHIACSAGSGAGKSVLAQLIAVQVLARGGRVVILDLKGSHRWALGLAGVDYCTRPEQMHTALVKLAKLADDRNQAALYEDEDWNPGERVFVIAEELNATFAKLRDYWAEARVKGQPKPSPAVRAFRDLLFMGRSAKVHVFGIAQMLSANTTGGPESRENFGIRCLARYTKNNWMMLCPEASMPRPSRTQGRWQIVVGGTATECQVTFLTASEARRFLVKVSPVAGTPLIGADQEMSPGHAPSGDIPADPLAELVTLRAFTDRDLVPWNHAAAKKRIQRRRKEGAPVPVAAGKEGQADLYRVGDLIEWAERELVSS